MQQTKLSSQQTQRLFPSSFLVIQKAGGGHGCFIVIGGDNVSDVRRAVDIALEYIGKYAGELYISQAGHLEFTFSACADKALHMAFNAPIGKPFGFFCGSLLPLD